jgi:putative addiction module CopG family antidote
LGAAASQARIQQTRCAACKPLPSDEPPIKRDELAEDWYENSLDTRLTIDSIYFTIETMNIALTKHFEELIARLVASGRYNNSSEVVRAGLRILDAEEKALGAASFPPGSLRHLYTRTNNHAERRTAKATSPKA